MISLWELTVGYAYQHDGDVRPLVKELRGDEPLMPEAREFLAKVLLGEIKPGDKRRSRRKAENLAGAFYVRRLQADLEEREHGAPHITNAAIYATLSAEPDTAERMIKRFRASRKAKRKG